MFSVKIRVFKVKESIYIGLKKLTLTDPTIYISGPIGAAGLGLGLGANVACHL